MEGEKLRIGALRTDGAMVRGGENVLRDGENVLRSGRNVLRSGERFRDAEGVMRTREGLTSRGSTRTRSELLGR
jgi:hypothetical protein